MVFEHVDVHQSVVEAFYPKTMFKIYLLDSEKVLKTRFISGLKQSPWTIIENVVEDLFLKSIAEI